MVRIQSYHASLTPRMPEITLPDGTRKVFEAPVTVMRVAESIGPGLAKAALAGEVDGRLVDACVEIERDAPLRVITAKDEEGLEIVRHSFAHLLGHAVKQLYPDAQMAIGPVIENGFYYDVAYRRPFTDDDLRTIERRMSELVEQNYDVVREVVSREQAVKAFEERGEPYKAQIAREIADGEIIALYRHQEYSGHVPRPARAEHAPLARVSLNRRGRRLLARRPQQRDVAAHLRHRVGRPQAAEGAPEAP